MVTKKIFQVTAQAVAVLVLLTSSSIAGWGQAQTFYPGGHMMAGGYMGWMMIFFWIMLLVILILIIRYVVQLTRIKNTEPMPLDILKNRLASGEIDLEEFEEKKKYLTS